MKSNLAKSLSKLIMRSLAPAVQPIYSGIGTVILFHRIVKEKNNNRVGWCHTIENTIMELKETVSTAKEMGLEFVSIDELHRRILSGKTSEKCCVITFDDGYLDVYTEAFPYLESQKIPFIFYISTSVPDKNQTPWWYLAEETLINNDSFNMSLGNAFTKVNLNQKGTRDFVFSLIQNVFESSPPEEIRSRSVEIFGLDRVLEIEDRLNISWEQIIEMSKSPLVTIGAHSVTHRNLAQLPATTALWEMEESKKIIESRIGRPVEHFAYPYGSPYHATQREFKIAQDAGFKTATTTRVGNIFKEHRSHLTTLPRIYISDITDIRIKMSGCYTAFHSIKRVVTD
jgi:peptidoglycan/xylan/chitin deacetylase (PgdA/CDA1 family)